MVKDYIIPTIIVAIFILLLLSLSQKIKLFYKVKDIPISKIQSAPQGIVALSGSLINEKNQLYESPVGGQPCNYWKVEISEISKNTRSKNHQPLQLSLSAPGNFLRLIDDTGSCYVSVQNADWKIKEIKYRKLGRELNEIKFGSKLKKIAHERKYLVVESWVPVENSTYIIGDFSSMPSNRSPIEDTWLIRTKRNKAPSSIWYKIADFSSQIFQSEMEKFMHIWETEMKKLEGISSKESLRGTKVAHWISRSDDWLRPSPFFISCFPLKNTQKSLSSGIGKNVIVICIYFALALSFFYWQYPHLFTK